MKIKEDLLQFIWLNKCFGKSITTTNQEEIVILQAGFWNKDAGPDFLNAKVKIGTTTLFGHIEIHVCTSDWIKHQHHKDPKYKAAILHVVFNHDITEHDYLPHLPVLELKQIISPTLLEKYQTLMESKLELPCQKLTSQIPSIIWTHWIEQLFVEKLELKSKSLEEYISNQNKDWNEILYFQTARSLGQSINGEAMQALATSVSLSIIGKHKNSLLQIEAMLFGVAGFLNITTRDEYVLRLQEEYFLLKNKYSLQEINSNLWNLLRLRPANFPTIRIAQLASVLYHSQHIFSKVKEIENLKTAMSLFEFGTSEYWKTHYTFLSESVYSVKKIGTSVICNIFINAIIPILWYYGTSSDNQNIKDKAITWLTFIPAENNKYTRILESINAPNTQAYHSQALLYLYKNYCTNKKCMTCKIGHAILK